MGITSKLFKSAKDIVGGNIKNIKKVVTTSTKKTGSKFLGKTADTSLAQGFKKAVVRTGAVAIPVGAGLYGINVGKDIFARTQDIRSFSAFLDEQDRANQIMKEAIDVQNERYAKNQEGGLGGQGSYYDQYQQLEGTKQTTTGYAVVGGLLLITAGFLAYKNAKKGKKQ